MANESKLKALWIQLNDKLQEQVWFQQIKTKWEELDPASRLYTKLGLTLSSVLVVFMLVIVSIVQVRGLKSELTQKTQLRMILQTANDEIQRLRASSGGFSPSMDSDSVDWKASLKAAATNSGLEESVLEFGPEKPSSNPSVMKEIFSTVKISKLNVKQLVRYAVQIESGASPVKLRHLTIDAKDPEGYLTATLDLSIFQPKKDK